MVSSIIRFILYGLLEVCSGSLILVHYEVECMESDRCGAPRPLTPFNAECGAERLSVKTGESQGEMINVGLHV